MRPGRDPVKTLETLSIDRYSQIPAYAQIKDGIKLAYAYRELSPGQALPSIRTLARQLGVGDGVVRRAYRELCETGVLAAHRRKHVVLGLSLNAASDDDVLVGACDEQCRLVMAWARDKQVSTLAFGRLLLTRALAEEIRSPSYMFVDICKPVAERCADKVARAWEIRVVGVCLSDLADLLRNQPRQMPAILINKHLYNDAVELAGDRKQRMFPVEIRIDEKLLRRMRDLRRRSSLLCVFADEQFPRAGMAMLRHFERLFGRQVRCQARAISEIPDLAALIGAGRYRWSLFSPLVWETLPARIKRMPTVAQMVWEPDPHALEAVRIPAGVLV